MNAGAGEGGTRCARLAARRGESGGGGRGRDDESRPTRRFGSSEGIQVSPFRFFVDVDGKTSCPAPKERPGTADPLVSPPGNATGRVLPFGEVLPCGPFRTRTSPTLSDPFDPASMACSNVAASPRTPRREEG